LRRAPAATVPGMEDWYLVVASSAAALAVMLAVALLGLIS
jgi:hypothetical protein